MKTAVLCLLTIAVLSGGFSDPSTLQETPDSNPAIVVPTAPDTSSSIPNSQTGLELIAVELIIGDKVFAAKLYDTVAARALLERLPLSIVMDDMNGNEKYYFFSDQLPTSPETPGQLSSGDLMLYGNDCLVLFYESFSSSYRYTKLGYLEQTDGLKEALSGNHVKVLISQVI